MSGPIAISVLVPAYNEEAWLRRLLTSVHNSFAEVGRQDYELIVCDNNSTDSTPTIARAGGATVVFDEHNQIARARNVAATAASGRLLIFIDADSELTSGLLQQTLERMESGQYCGGGAWVSMDPDKTPFAMRLVLYLWNIISSIFGWAAGSYVFCLQEAWKDIGGFDERYYANEEIAFSRNLKKWARKRKMRFVIITREAVCTSSRKAEQFSLSEMICQLLLCCLPGSLRRRDRCKFWYMRKPESDASD